MRLGGKVSESVHVIPGEPQGSVYGRCCLQYTSKLFFCFIGKHIVVHVDDTMI